MKLATARQMTTLEQIAIHTYGIDGLILMENAARSFCDVLEAKWGNISRKDVAVFCGKGNNGGDGFAIGRHLANRGAKVTVVTDFSPNDLKQDAKINFDILGHMQLPVITTAEAANLRFDIGVDALLGTGFSGKVSGEMATAVKTIASVCQAVAAVDIPSGADASSGIVSGPCVSADITITFALPKPGHFLYPAKEFCGEVFTTDISIPKKIIDDFEADCYSLDGEVAKKLPPRKENSHKGSYGKVLVFAGSHGMSGAAIMTTAAVLKTGAGMVTTALPADMCSDFASRFPEGMTLPLPPDGDDIPQKTIDLLEAKLSTQSVLLAGCGLGTDANTQEALRRVVARCEKPMVIDADGINALVGHIDIIKHKPIPAIVTPHPLEFSRLSGLAPEEIASNRLQIARSFAQENGLVLVLKGADTLVAFPSGTVSILTQSNSGLAKAGSGDVLAGIIAALMAQGLTPEDAGILGVYLHSRAGMIARKQQGAYSMLASDVLAALPQALTELTSL